MLEILYTGLINSILIPDYESLLNDNSNSSSTAVSNLKPFSGEINTDYTIVIERLTETVRAGLCFSQGHFRPEAEIRLALMSGIKKTELLLRILTRRGIKGVTLDKNNYLKGNLYEYMIIGKFKDREIIIKVIIESRYFNLLYPQVNSEPVHDNIVNELKPFFQNPLILRPPLEPVIELLPSEKLADLFNLMLRKDGLTPYQIAAAIIAFPHLKSKILNSLSENIRKDIYFNLKKYSGLHRITKRDSAAALYAIEEGLKDILLEDNSTYFPELKFISGIIRKIHRYELYSKKNLLLVIEEIEKNDLMHKTLSFCNDSVIREVFSRKRNLLSKFLPEQRINELFSIDEKLTLGEKIERELKFIESYRKLYLSGKGISHERLPFLIVSMKSAKDFSCLLNETGWYLLSTAMKGTGEKISEKIIENLPADAAALIKDILKGRVNPDIIHDEKQIITAMKKVAEKIIFLYSQSLIDLDC